MAICLRQTLLGIDIRTEKQIQVTVSVDAKNHTKDIDFTPGGIEKRWSAGYADAKDAIAQRPWTRAIDPIEGLLLHEHESTRATM